MAPPNDVNEPPNALFAKLAGFNAIIPQFDNTSAVTPVFFLDALESVTSIANCSDPEKLLVLKSRIRGDALSHLINSPDLSQEKDFKEFKTKFLNYFENKASLAARQQQFANCRMIENENVKVYASRVADATQKFFGNINLNNAEVKALFEQTKLSKFLEGLLPNLKKETIMKDPQSFLEAVNFVDLLQANEMPESKSINAFKSSAAVSNEDLLKLIDFQNKTMQETVAALEKKLNNFTFEKMKDSRNPNTTQNFGQERFNKGSIQRNSSYHFQPRNHSSAFRPQSFQCTYCGRRNHLSRNCFYAPSGSQNTPRFNNAGRTNFGGQRTPFAQNDQRYRNRFSHREQTPRFVRQDDLNG